MENKPKNFKEAALSHIPPEFLKAMEQCSNITPEDMASLAEVVREKGPLIRASIPGKQPPAPIAQPPALSGQPAFISFAIEGHVVNVPTDDVGAAIMMFYTLLAFVWSKDKKVAKILKQFDFKFLDANKKQVYPKNRKHGSK